MNSGAATARWPRLAGILTLGGARVAVAGLTALGALLVAPALGPAQLGVWAMLLACQGWTLHLAEAGLRSVVTAEAIRTSGGAMALLPVYLALRLPLAAIVGIAGVVLAFLVEPAALQAAALIATSLPAVALQLDWMALVAGRARAASLLLLVRPATFCLLIALTPAPLTVERAALAFALAWWLAALLSWPTVRIPNSGVPATLPPPSALDLIGRGLPLMVLTLGNQALLSLDLLLVGAWAGREAAGHYYLAAAIAVAGTAFANAINQLAMARLAVWRDDPAGLRQAVAAELRQALLLGLAPALALALAGPVLLPSLFGAAFAPSGLLLAAFAPWLLLQHGTALLQGALVAGGQTKPLLRANFTMLAVAVAGALLGLVLGELVLVALARGLAELARLAMLNGCMARPWRDPDAAVR